MGVFVDDSEDLPFNDLKTRPVLQDGDLSLIPEHFALHGNAGVESVPLLRESIGNAAHRGSAGCRSLDRCFQMLSLRLSQTSSFGSSVGAVFGGVRGSERNQQADGVGPKRDDGQPEQSPRGVADLFLNRAGILTGYKRSSRDAYIARLQAKGLVEVRGPQLFPTDDGRAALNGSYEPLPTGEALIDYWRTRLPEGERRTLDVLLKHGGHEIAREEIDEATGYKRSSRDAYLVRLKARGLVEFAGRGLVRASDELFD